MPRWKHVYLDESEQDKQSRRWRVAYPMEWPLFYGPACGPEDARFSPGGISGSDRKIISVKTGIFRDRLTKSGGELKP